MDKQYVETWNQAVGYGQRYWHNLEAFEDEREDFEADRLSDDFHGVTELECYTHARPTWSAARLLATLADNLDDNYHGEESTWSDYYTANNDDELEKRLQLVIDDFIARSSFVRYESTGKWIKV